MYYIDLYEDSDPYKYIFLTMNERLMLDSKKIIFSLISNIYCFWISWDWLFDISKCLSLVFYILFNSFFSFRFCHRIVIFCWSYYIDIFTMACCLSQCVADITQIKLEFEWSFCNIITFQYLNLICSKKNHNIHQRHS